MRFALAGVLMMAQAAAGQNAAPVKAPASWRVNFTLHETDEGKRLSTRNYSMLVEAGNYGRIRIGTKVPVATGERQFQYYDVGLNFDCKLNEVNSELRFNASMDVSSVDAEKPPAGSNPVVRQMRAEAAGAITPGKATSIATLDDPATRRHYEFEMTATPVR